MRSLAITLTAAAIGAGIVAGTALVHALQTALAGIGG